MESGGHREGWRPAPRLTRAELDVYSTLDDLFDELGYAPTYAQILAKLDWSPKSKGALHEYLNRLRRLGLLSGSGRSLKLL